MLQEFYPPCSSRNHSDNIPHHDSSAAGNRFSGADIRIYFDAAHILSLTGFDYMFAAAIPTVRRASTRPCSDVAEKGVEKVSTRHATKACATQP